MAVYATGLSSGFNFQGRFKILDIYHSYSHLDFFILQPVYEILSRDYFSHSCWKPSWRAFLLRRHTPASFLRFSGVLFSSADVRSPWSISGRTEDPEHGIGSSNLVALCREESEVLQQRLL
ncbi:hypothetical protein TNCV_4621331 [Trichonephila clavipes]|nr:hypothetical protein TNCV_4621331 [Trichonephila clavipes]